MWTYRPSDQPVPLPKNRSNAKTPAGVSPLKEQKRQGFVPPTPAAVPAQRARAEKETGRGAAENISSAAALPRRRKSGAKPSLRLACVLGSLYLCGLAAGSVCSQLLREPLSTYAHYFASIGLQLHTTGTGAMVFSAGFLSMFCQLTLLLLAGFCVLGVGLIPVTLLLKGFGTGVFIALVYQELGAGKGLLLQCLVLWLPEVLGCLLIILLSIRALHVSSGLLRCCLGHSGTGMRVSAHKLVYHYLTINFFSMLVCGLSVVLVLLFGRLF